MLEQKSRANWLNTENARCHRTVYITMQNVTSKLQIGLSPEMGWYHLSFTIILNKDVWMCRHQVAVHDHCSKTVWDHFVLAYTPGVLRVFWRLSIRYRSCFFHSNIFHPCYLLLLFPLLHFPLPHFQRPRRCSSKNRRGYSGFAGGVHGLPWSLWPETFCCGVLVWYSIQCWPVLPGSSDDKTWFELVNTLLATKTCPTHFHL